MATKLFNVFVTFSKVQALEAFSVTSPEEEIALMAAIAALSYVAGNAWGYNAGDTGHEWRLLKLR